MTALGVLGVLAVLFGTAVLATRADPLLAPAPRDRPDVELPDRPLAAQDVAAVRFSMALRGYRMSEVDAVLDRLAAELDARDRRIADLSDSGRPPGDAGAPAGPPPAVAPAGAPPAVAPAGPPLAGESAVAADGVDDAAVQQVQ